MSTTLSLIVTALSDVRAPQRTYHLTYPVAPPVRVSLYQVKYLNIKYNYSEKILT